MRIVHLSDIHLSLSDKRSPKKKSHPDMLTKWHIGMCFCKSELPMQKVPVADCL